MAKTLDLPVGAARIFAARGAHATEQGENAGAASTSRAGS